MSNDTSINILIVDDEAPLSDMLNAYLTALGYNCLVATDGDHALKVLESAPVDLVITDVNMPKRSGASLLAELNTTRPNLPVIMMTGAPTVTGAVDSLKRGAVDYITKPFSLPTLGEVVQKALANRQTGTTKPPMDGTAMPVRRRSAGPGQKLQPAPLPESDDPMERTVVVRTHDRYIGQYQTIKLLGEGNMGFVYLARPRKDPHGEPVAIKVLKPQWLSDGQKSTVVERFLREAAAAQRVSHPNILKILEYGVVEDEQLPYLVMELLHGKSMKELIVERVPLDLREKLTVIQQVAEALGALHGVGICHRDIKPANIMVDEHLKVTLTDFGIARLPDSNLTMTSCLMGSPAYLAPEGFLSPKVDARADFFSLGVVAYEFLLGARPFDADNITALAMRVRNDKPRHPKQHDPEFPPAVTNILARLLKKQPVDRYQTASELLADLAKVLARKSLRPTMMESFRTTTSSDWN